MTEPMGTRLKLGIAVVGLGVFLAFFANDLLSRIDFRTERWEQPYLFPLVLPVGADFREGLFYPAKILLQGKSPYLDYSSIYPPFTILLAAPFRLFTVSTAYLLQVVLLYGLNILTIWGAIKIAASARATEAGASPGATLELPLELPLFLLISFLILTSYGFFFSVERGNNDAYAQCAAILGLWLMLRRPEKLWLQALAFSVAAHLKLYPAILFLLPLWQHGRRSLLPLVVINALLLLSTGPANAVEFAEVMVRYAGQPFLWVGNHSAASFSLLVNGYLIPHVGLQLPTLVFYLLPAALWLLGAFTLWRKGFSPGGAVWLFILSVPMMSVIPSTSHDYKLVLIGAPVAMVFSRLIFDYATLDERVRLLQIGAVMVLMLFLTRSYTMLPPLLGNKYPFLLALELVFVWTILVPRVRTPPVNGPRGAVTLAGHDA